MQLYLLEAFADRVKSTVRPHNNFMCFFLRDNRVFPPPYRELKLLLSFRRDVFTARYELNLYTHRLILVFKSSVPCQYYSTGDT